MRKTYTWEDSRNLACHRLLKFKKNNFNYNLLFFLPTKFGSIEAFEKKRISEFLQQITEIVYPHLSRNFSKKYVADEIFHDIIYKNLFEEPYSFDEMKDIFDRIKKEHDQYSCGSLLVFPVTNILICQEECINIKGIQLWKFDAFYKRMQKQCSIEQKSIWERGIDDISTVAVLENTKEMKKAYTEGKSKVEALLNTFQFCDINNVRRKDVCPYSLWLGPTMYEKYVLMESNDHQFGPYHVLPDYSDGRIFFPLKDEDILKDKKFDLVFELLSADISSLTEIQKAAREAISWFIKAERIKDYQTSFLLYILSLEYIFKCGRGFSENIGNGIAEIMGNNVKEKIELRDFVKNLYDKRSSIVHGSFDNNTEYMQVFSARNISKEAILFLLENYNKFNKREDVLSYFKKKDFISIRSLLCKALLHPFGKMNLNSKG